MEEAVLSPHPEMYTMLPQAVTKHVVSESILSRLTRSRRASAIGTNFILYGIQSIMKKCLVLFVVMYHLCHCRVGKVLWEEH